MIANKRTMRPLPFRPVADGAISITRPQRVRQARSATAAGTGTATTFTPTPVRTETLEMIEAIRAGLTPVCHPLPFPSDPSL
jgi:hypothetical protein